MCVFVVRSILFFVSSSHEWFIEENRWFWEGAIVESVLLDTAFAEILIFDLISAGSSAPLSGTGDKLTYLVCLVTQYLPYYSEITLSTIESSAVLDYW